MIPFVYPLLPHVPLGSFEDRNFIVAWLTRASRSQIYGQIWTKGESCGKDNQIFLIASLCTKTSGRGQTVED